MNTIIEKILKRAGVKDVTQLTIEERATYNKIINDLKERAKPITIKDWEEFLQEELVKTINVFNPDDSQKKKDFLWHQTFLIQKLLDFLQKPKREEKQIKEQYKI